MIVLVRGARALKTLDGAQPLQKFDDYEFKSKKFPLQVAPHSRFERVPSSIRNFVYANSFAPKHSPFVIKFWSSWRRRSLVSEIIILFSPVCQILHFPVVSSLPYRNNIFMFRILSNLLYIYYPVFPMHVHMLSVVFAYRACSLRKWVSVKKYVKQLRN